MHLSTLTLKTRSKDINKVSVVFDQLVSGYTEEDEENAIDTIYKNIQR